MEEWSTCMDQVHCFKNSKEAFILVVCTRKDRRSICLVDQRSPDHTTIEGIGIEGILVCEHPIASLHGWGATNLGIEFKFTGAEKSLFYCTSNSNKITDLLIASLNEIKEETQQKSIEEEQQVPAGKVQVRAYIDAVQYQQPTKGNQHQQQEEL